MKNTDKLSGDAITLDSGQRETLSAVLDLIIAPSQDGRLPGAAEYDVWSYICRVSPELLTTIRDELDRLDTHCRTEHRKPLYALAAVEREAVVEALRAANPGFMRGLAHQTVCCYYQQDRVLKAIGMQPRPPFPVGYEVKSGDLSLLDPVRRRGKVYRDTS